MKELIKITSRTEVAKRWREIGERLDKTPPTSLTGTACVTLFELLGSAGIRDNNSYSDVFNRLADLIDPTCHVTDEEVTHEPTLNALAVHVYRCDKCSWYFYMAEVCCHPKPFYCPMCGARVVRDD